MLEDDYTKCLNKLLESCECDLAVPSQWQERLQQHGSTQPIPDDRRKSERHLFNSQGVLEFGQTFPAIPREETTAQVMMRDVSADGVAFLFSEQLFPGELISLWLPSGKQTYVVERCVGYSDDCYEIGAAVAGPATELTASQANITSLN